MNILEALIQLRDDLKTWCINNFNNKLNKNLGTTNNGQFLITDDNGEVTTVNIEATVDELNYVSGVASNVQTQLDNKAGQKVPQGTTYTDDEGNTYTAGVGAEIFNCYDGDSTNKAYGGYSHAEGYQTMAGGFYGSHAEGTATISSGGSSHAEGGITTASGTYSHAEGYDTTASGASSHAEGYGAQAAGMYSHAEGWNTIAEGDTSHAEGVVTHALGYQHAQGHYNNTTTAKAGTNSGTGSGTAFVIGNGTATSASNAFRVTYAGQIYANSSITTGGRDYAEFFEWQDSNPNAEDRRGYFVTLDGDKIKIAAPNDYILGIVSGRPAVLGNSDEDWRGRYILDDFGDFITEEFEYEEEIVKKVLNEKTGEITTETTTVTTIGTKYKENPDYDPTLPYIQREDRPEWDAVGMLGVLSVRDDGTCKVNGYCKVADGGIATTSETGYRVIKRVNDNIVKVIFK